MMISCGKCGEKYYYDSVHVCQTKETKLVQHKLIRNRNERQVWISSINGVRYSAFIDRANNSKSELEKEFWIQRADEIKRGMK